MGPTLTHGMMPLGGKVKVVGLSGEEILSTNHKVTSGKVRDKRRASSPFLGRKRAVGRGERAYSKMVDF